jgi:hypothetical protein
VSNRKLKHFYGIEGSDLNNIQCDTKKKQDKS